MSVTSLLLSLVFTVTVYAAESESAAAPKFLGSQSCASSSCHGGAGDISKQFTIWSQYDFHHQRPYATLTTARSERLADVLKLGKPTESARCTVCHAPFQTVPPERLAKGVKVTEGVSCESCHGPAENWLRSHTRKDYTHEDRVHAGMRDLKNIYVRANTCVACHQNVDADILAAGHPELIFELDGQCVTMPKHWRKSEDKPGPQIWLVGQFVAAREMMAPRQLSYNTPQDRARVELQLARHKGLSWLLDKIEEPIVPNAEYEGAADYYHDWIARLISTNLWSEDSTRACLKMLLNTSGNQQVTNSIHARHAERLVLALDRLVVALPGAKNDAVDTALDRLFADVQSIPDFDPNQFAKDLEEFKSRVSGALESK